MDAIITSPSPTHLSWRDILGVLAALTSLCFACDGLVAFVRGAKKSLPKEYAPQPQVPTTTENWDTLCSRANQIISDLISQFPVDIAAEAKQVPCLFKEREEQEADGYLTLGTYHNFIPRHKSDHMGPIFLFLKSIEEHCQEKSVNFEEEVKRVYLHELGHHFGWDEVDLVRHGLPSGRPPGEP